MKFLMDPEHMSIINDVYIDQFYASVFIVLILLLLILQSCTMIDVLQLLAEHEIIYNLQVF